MLHFNDIEVDRLVRSWSEVASATTAAASTTTHAAVAGAKHVVTNIHAGTDTDAAPILVELKFGSTVAWRGYLLNTLDVQMELMDSTANQAANLEVAAAAAGIATVASLQGYTVDGG